ncbi:hypothetical protein [Nocardia sp. NPDC057227]|uniref:hypothetical protein n=1 Tax=Nocardia sp. NPDC057227 TaxID=3346056 RepID=UPI003635191A
MSDWREGFYRDVADYLERTELAEQRPAGNWKKIDRILDISERIDPGFSGSDVTAGDDPEIELTISWVDVSGGRFTISRHMSLTELMRKLDEKERA